MNTNQIYGAMVGNAETKKSFKGVFPADCLPLKKLKKPAFVIANTDDRYSAGQHWVCFYFPKKEDAPGHYFDSFGGKPTKKEFLIFLKRNCKKIVHNKQQLQGNLSSTCGHWSCVYGYYRCIGQNLKNFLKMFSKKNLELNDTKIVHLYHKHFASTKAPLHSQKGGRKTKKICQTCKPRIK